MIVEYLNKCGKVTQFNDLRNLMTECGQQCNIKGFNGEDDIDFDTFY